MFCAFPGVVCAGGLNGGSCTRYQAFQQFFRDLGVYLLLFSMVAHIPVHGVLWTSARSCSIDSKFHSSRSSLRWVSQVLALEQKHLSRKQAASRPQNLPKNLANDCRSPKNPPKIGSRNWPLFSGPELTQKYCLPVCCRKRIG